GNTVQVATDPQLLLANAREQKDWDEKNDRAIGSICLRLSPSLRHHKTDSDTAATLWTTLKGTYDKAGPGIVYADFKQAVSFKVSGNVHPLTEINKLWTLLERLKTNGVNLTGSVRAMILLNALPSSMNNVVSNQVSDNDFSNLSFTDIRDHIVGDWEHHNPQASFDAKKLSAVKRKGKNPKFKAQQKNQSLGNTGNSYGKNYRGKRAGQKFKNHKGNNQPGTPSTHNDSHGHSHIASIADPFVAAPAITPALDNTTSVLREKGRSKVVDPNPQRYTGAVIGPSAYADVNLARELCSEIGVAKTAQNMEVLENVASSSKRLLEDNAGSSESKISHAMDSNMDPAGPIDWDTLDMASLDVGTSNDMDVDAKIQKLIEEQIILNDEVGNMDYKDFVKLVSVATSIQNHFVLCSNCKGKEREGNNWIMDSGASRHFTFEPNDFADYYPLSNGPIVKHSVQEYTIAS
ncbi:hypothetical protein MPER_12932, partial [Moniliophthora perniciosa FA553]